MRDARRVGAKARVLAVAVARAAALALERTRDSSSFPPRISARATFSWGGTASPRGICCSSAASPPRDRSRESRVEVARGRRAARRDAEGREPTRGSSPVAVTRKHAGSARARPWAARCQKRRRPPAPREAGSRSPPTSSTSGRARVRTESRRRESHAGIDGRFASARVAARATERDASARPAARTARKSEWAEALFQIFQLRDAARSRAGGSLGKFATFAM